MKFYCPNCQQEYETEPRETVTTLQGRRAYKAFCPVCNQDMAEFIKGEKTLKPPVKQGQVSAAPSGEVVDEGQEQVAVKAASDLTAASG
jgi:hypothetical protein